MFARLDRVAVDASAQNRGIGAALHPNGLIDRGVLVYVSVALAIPSFWLAIVLVLVFAVRLRWLPAIDLQGPQSFVLPVITLAVALTPVLIRTIRQSLLDTLGEDHVRAARARGIPERRVIMVHGLKVAALPLITLIGLQAGLVLAGSYVVESIFNWPGIGKLTLDALAFVQETFVLWVFFALGARLIAVHQEREGLGGEPAV